MKDIHPDIAELLAIRATEGLSQSQQEDLVRLLEEHQCDDSTAFDLSAAAAANAFMLESAATAEDAPDTLKEKLRRDADRFFPVICSVPVTWLPRRLAPRRPANPIVS